MDIDNGHIEFEMDSTYHQTLSSATLDVEETLMDSLGKTPDEIRASRNNDGTILATAIYKRD